MADEDPLAGKADQVAGKAKELGGKVTGDEDLEAEGRLQHTAGKVEEKLHEAAEKAREVFDRLRHHDKEKDAG